MNENEYVYKMQLKKGELYEMLNSVSFGFILKHNIHVEITIKQIGCFVLLQQSVEL